MDALRHEVGRWVGRAARSPRAAPLPGAEWPSARTLRPSHELSLDARLRQERVVPLDSYEIHSSRFQVAIVGHLPGVEPAEVSLAVDPGLVTISTEIGNDEGDAGHGPLWRICRESRLTRRSQTLSIPQGLDVDSWAATLEGSVLRLTIPRRR